MECDGGGPAIVGLLEKQEPIGGAVVKVLVTYLSKTGNTRKVAEAIFGEIADDKEMRPIDQIASIEGYDIAFLGLPVHAQGPDKGEVKLLEKLCVNGRSVALFITHASPEDAPELQQSLGKFRQAARGANLVDVFDCQGQLAKGIKLIMSIMPNADYRRWAKVDNSQGQPDEARLERARTFSRNVMARLHAGRPKAMAAV